MYGLWRRVFAEIAAEYDDVPSEMRYVDALAMEMVRVPERFGIIVTGNLLGDILSDLAAEIVGGPGLAPSANVHPGKHGLYEPVHGSAPDLVGTGKANPMAAVLSAAMLLSDHGAKEAGRCLEAAVDAALLRGPRRRPTSGGSVLDDRGGRLALRPGYPAGALTPSGVDFAPPRRSARSPFGRYFQGPNDKTHLSRIEEFSG